MNLRSLTLLASLAVVVAAPSIVGCAVDTADSSNQFGVDDGRETESVRCADGATVEGLDVSYYQGKVNWASVKASGRAFAIARISDGGYHDPDFATNWSGMKAAGLIRGAYPFFEPSQDPVTQANIVIAAVGKLGNGDLPVTLDVEVTGSESASVINSRIHTWFDHVKAGTGKSPIIYTGKYFWQDNVASNDFVNSPLWIAAYGVSCPNIPGPWTNWKFFQYTDKGSVPGIAGGVDLDKFNGTLADLEAFANGGGTSSSSSSSGSSSSAATCHSATLGRDVPVNTCVLSASDGLWYECAASGSWINREGDVGSCPQEGLCYSNTLKREVPINTCVQSASDSKWYQCAGPNDWVNRWTDPANCSSVHPL
jgi:lysozyme